jgi:hypothetical protein
MGLVSQQEHANAHQNGCMCLPPQHLACEVFLLVRGT